MTNDDQVWVRLLAKPLVRLNRPRRCSSHRTKVLRKRWARAAKIMDYAQEYNVAFWGGVRIEN